MWVTALGINALILAALVWLLRPAFETNDDTALLTLVNGAKISSDPHMVISGVFLGKVLMLLYGVTRTLPWYTLVQYAMLFTAFTGITWVLLHRLGILWGIVLSVCTVVWFGYESYIVIQFSRTAGIAAASAMFLLFFFVSEQGRRRWGSALTALGLAMFASSMRFTQFLPCMALTTGIGLWMLLDVFAPVSRSKAQTYSRYQESEAAAGGGQILRRLVLLFAPFVCVALVCVGLRVWDKASYAKDPLWKQFRDFDVLREELYDYGFPDYPANVETYREAGISDAGYTLYRNWNFADPDRFTPEVMEKLIAVKEPRHFGKSTIIGFMREVPSKLLTRPTVWFFLFLLVAFLAGGREKKGQGRNRASAGISGRSILCVLWGILLFGALYLYLYYQGRYLRNRVDTGLLYALCLSVMWFVRPAGVRRTWWIVPALTAALIFVPAVKHNYPFRYKASVAKKERKLQKRRRSFEELSADGDHLYVMKMGSMIAHDCYGPFDIMPEKVIGNVLYLGGWAAYTAAFMDTMQAYDISNPFRDLIGNEQLRLVDNDIEMTMTYLRENYDPGAAYEAVGELGKYTIYKILAGSEAP